MKSLEWDAKKPISDNAKAYLPALAHQFFESGREAAKPATSHHALHRFRLHIKRFRYTLELFREYYGPGLEERIESLRDLQQLLGEISDCWATENLLTKREDLSKAELDGLRRKLQAMARVRVAAFRSRWSKDFSTDRHERSWVAYLSRFARPNRKK